jgi:hypothetical protein
LSDAPFVFQALAVYVGRSAEASCFMVALADHPENTDNAFVLMRPDEFDGPDHARSDDEEYTLVTGSGKTTQGGVLSATVGEDTVEFRLSGGAAAQLGIPEHFVIGIGQGNSTQVRGGLVRVVGSDAIGSYA